MYHNKLKKLQQLVHQKLTKFDRQLPLPYSLPGRRRRHRLRTPVPAAISRNATAQGGSIRWAPRCMQGTLAPPYVVAVLEAIAASSSGRRGVSGEGVLDRELTGGFRRRSVDNSASPRIRPPPERSRGSPPRRTSPRLPVSVRRCLLQRRQRKISWADVISSPSNKMGLIRSST